MGSTNTNNENHPAFSHIRDNCEWKLNTLPTYNTWGGKLLVKPLQQYSTSPKDKPAQLIDCNMPPHPHNIKNLLNRRIIERDVPRRGIGGVRQSNLRSLKSENWPETKHLGKPGTALCYIPLFPTEYLPPTNNLPLKMKKRRLFNHHE